MKRRGKYLLGGLVVLLALGAGAGGYFLGESSGPDIQAAKEQSADEGRADGRRVGRREGEKVGFEQGRDDAFKPAFADAYTRAFRAEFANAGLDRPKNVEVPKR